MKIDWLRFLPPYWLQNYPTSWEWDEMLNRLLDSGAKITPGEYTTVIGQVEVWTSNWPYAFGRPYTPRAGVLPSVSTRKRLREAIRLSSPPAEHLDKLRCAVEASL